jgi:hypothetical protein
VCTRHVSLVNTVVMVTDTAGSVPASVPMISATATTIVHLCRNWSVGTQSKILRAIANAPWYVSNHTLHTDLQIPYVSSVVKDKINKHYEKLGIHSNKAIKPLLQPTHDRRLRRTWPNDLRNTEA